MPPKNVKKLFKVTYILSNSGGGMRMGGQIEVWATDETEAVQIARKTTGHLHDGIFSATEMTE